MRAAAGSADDLIARATSGRWSPSTLLEEVTRIEVTDRGRRSLERRLRRSRVGRFKPMADFDWNWPKRSTALVSNRSSLAAFFAKSAMSFSLGRMASVRP
jgi:hypothetical protein